MIYAYCVNIMCILLQTKINFFQLPSKPLCSRVFTGVKIWCIQKYTLYHLIPLYSVKYQNRKRKKHSFRVTLMVATVSAVFVISWGTDMLLHILDEFDFIKLGPYAFPIAHTVIMFNSAVNPYAYALINQRFRQKMKGMIRCNLISFATRVAPEREPRDIDMKNNIGAHSSDKAETTSTE